MFFQPLLYDVNWNRHIDEKMYKLEIQNNEDDREISETADTNAQTTDIINELTECVSLTRDFYNTLAGYSVRPAEQKDVPSTSRLTSKIDRTSALIDATDFNEFNPNNISKIEGFIDQLQTLSNRLQEWTPDADLPATLQNILEGILPQVNNNLTGLLNIAEAKIMGRRPTEQVLGTGCCSGTEALCLYDRFGFMDVSPYQPTQYLYVG
jgi:hypothetical protein